MRTCLFLIGIASRHTMLRPFSPRIWDRLYRKCPFIYPLRYWLEDHSLSVSGDSARHSPESKSLCRLSYPRSDPRACTGTVIEREDAHTDNLQLSKNGKMSADAGIRTRVLTLARLSDNQLHYVHTGRLWILSSDIKVATRRMGSRATLPLQSFLYPYIRAPGTVQRRRLSESVSGRFRIE